jgi:hypothetical protein
VWGCLGKTLAAKVQKLQNRAFRIITRENYTTRSADILNKLGVPNLEKRRMQQLSILMYKVKNKLVHDYLYDTAICVQAQTANIFARLFTFETCRLPLETECFTAHVSCYSSVA